MKYVTGDGRTISVGKEIGAGGEGAVFEVIGSPQLLAKIYKKPDLRRAAKLSAIIGLPNSQFKSFAAWPLTTLHTSSGTTATGFLMPRVNGGRQIHELDTPAHRRANYPHADWRFLIRAARNCAAAVTAIHDAGIVIGDVNQGGFLVSKDALVRVIDCDSFQIQTSNGTYLCEVAVPEFLPPEIDGSSLSRTVRTTNHDAFGLAILIFRLLMMGRHPFAGYRGRGDKPIPEAIKEYRFAFAPDAHAMEMAPPPHSLLLGDLSPEIATSFLRAFSRGSAQNGARPSARRWAETLGRLEAQLQRCSIDPAHYHFGGLKDCPWCRIERGSGPNYFISVSIQLLAASPAQVDIGPIWTQIVAIPKPDAYLAAMRQAVPIRCIPKPLPASFQGQRNFMRTMGLLALASTTLLLLGVFNVAFAVIMLPVCLCIVGVWAVAYVNSPHYQERQSRRSNLHNQERELASVQRAVEATVAALTSECDKRRWEASKQKDKFEGFRNQETQEVNQLQANAQMRQLEEYLDGFLIEAARIEGIGPGRIAALESFGVETAADATEAKIGLVPGFGPKLTERLLNWRASLVAKFRFDPVRGVPQADLYRIRNRFLQMRYLCQRQLESSRNELTRLAVAANDEVQRAAGRIGQLRVAVAQARADLELCK
ncbi:MAG: hypothetical protein L0Z50_07275 [Verrucomicrobiales bacterium]|nr:hypothetical protein [Verrucomicrobiales bacterium]